MAVKLQMWSKQPSLHAFKNLDLEKRQHHKIVPQVDKMLRGNMKSQNHSECLE